MENWKPYIFFQNGWENWECLVWKTDNLEKEREDLKYLIHICFPAEAK